MGLLDFFRSEKRNNNFLKGNFTFGGAANKTAVTTESSMTFSAVFACVRIISESIASLPVRVYKLESDGDKIQEISHPINKLLTRNPNEFMTYELSTGRIVANGADFDKKTEYTCGILNLNDNQELLTARKNILIQLHKSEDQALEWIDYFNEFPSLISFYKRMLL